MDNNFVIKPIVFGSNLWERLADYADTCSWGAGKNLAKQMRANGFCDFERVFVALIDDYIAGYCTFAKTDCFPSLPYTPYIGYMFVGEQYRGNRLSEEIINFVLGYAKEQGFKKVYLISDHINLYEKYGFIKIDKKPAPWNPNAVETIFMHVT